MFLLLLMNLMCKNIFCQVFIEQPGFSLPGIRNGSLAWGDFDNDGDKDILMTGENYSRVYINNNSSFTDYIDLTAASNSCAAWGDYNNDGFLDILLAGSMNGTSKTLVFGNNGDGTFTEQTEIILPGVKYCSLAWGDLNNDGFDDIVISGLADIGGAITKIYLNNRDNTFTENVNASLTGAYLSVSLGDYDNDGQIDILLTGSSSSAMTKIYHNNGDNTFSELTGISVPGFTSGSASWGDYDNDKDLDIAITGDMGSTMRISKIFRNDGNNVFSEQTGIVLPGLRNSTLAWCDYDMDGYIDLALSGNSATGHISRIFRNKGDGGFEELTGISLWGVWGSSLAWGDYNGDEKPDLLLAGYSTIGYVGPLMKLYTNQVTSVFPVPGTPEGLNSQVDGTGVRLEWNSLIPDANTHPALTYNLMIGNNPGEINACSPLSEQNGYRLIPKSGNAQLNNFRIIRNLPKGTYYWSVQAVDKSYRGGSFSESNSFQIDDYSQASYLTASGIEGTKVFLNWEKGNLDYCIVFVKEGSTGKALPSDNTSYTANSEFGTGSQIESSGWFCVYNGTGGNVSITGLKPLTNYLFQVIMFESTGAGTEQYLDLSSENNPAAFSTRLFTAQADFQDLRGTVIWGDYDNDGHLDILSGSKIYHNNKDETFSEQSGLPFLTVIPFPQTADWCDYNNDGNLDVLITGRTAEPANKTVIFKNNGNGSFSEQNEITLTGVFSGSTAWGDYDNDGLNDILMTGHSGNDYISKIYRNNGNNSFSEQPHIKLTGVAYSSVSWKDYDNDKDLDILITGQTSEGTSLVKIYNNEGGGSFKEQTENNLPSVGNGACSWEDFNQDGFPDLVIAGITVANTWMTKLYINNKDNTFSEQTGTELAAMGDPVLSTGDFDNDGYADLLMTGSVNNTPVTKFYRNNKNGNLIEMNEITLPGINIGNVNNSKLWGDYDNDGKLDLLIPGTISRLYHNDISASNNKPEKPEMLAAEISGTSVVLNWNPVSSDETPVLSMSYNISVGTTLSGINIKSPEASPEGFRLIASDGNSGLLTRSQLNGLRWNTVYFAKVQAIDNGFRGSEFSNEVQFEAEMVQSSGIKARHIDNSSILIKWNRGNGDRCIIFAREGSGGAASPVNNLTYFANPSFGDGSPIENTDWFCIYKGEADSVFVTGLDALGNYTFHVLELQGINGSEFYYEEANNDNIGIFSSGLFSEQTEIGLPGLYRSSVSWGDYDNNGYLDFILTGSTNGSTSGAITKIYKNNGDNTFSELPVTTLPKVFNGTAEWGDYDNNGNLDLLITGATSTGNVSKIFHNNGNSTFTELSPLNLPAVQYSSSVWGDYNNDGRLDILISGLSGTTAIAKVYLNEGNSIFTEQTGIVLAPIQYPVTRWEDYNRDGYLDLFHTGYNNSNYISHIYRNNKNNNFEEQTNISVPPVTGSIRWNDYNKDGYPDILLSGETGGSVDKRISAVYRNAGGENFIILGEINMPGLYSSSVAWGDYDNDGYPDILLTGTTGPVCKTKIFHNNRNNSFTELGDVEFTGVSGGDIEWADYDNDGDLDFIITGSNLNSGFTKIYRNNMIMGKDTYGSNNPPNPPENLKNKVLPNSVKLSWKPAEDEETPSAALTYNVMIGTSENSCDILYSHSGPDGKRSIISEGNAYSDTIFLINNLTPGTYYWKVQSVDQGYKASSWSETSTFTVKSTQAFFTSDTVCRGFPTSFTDQSVSSDGIESWLWDFQDGSNSTFQNPTHTFSAGGIFKVRLVITSLLGEKDTLDQNVIVKHTPSADYSASIACQGSETTLINLTNTYELTITDWMWDYGDGKGSILQNPGSHGYLTAGEYQLSLFATADNGCSDTIQKTVFVAAYPVAEITANAPLTFCKGDSVALSVPYNDDYLYTWKLDGTALSGADSSRFVAKLSGSYTAEVVNSKGSCKTTSSATAITANDAPSPPTILTTGETKICQGDSVILSVTNTTGYSYLWRLNGGSVGTDSNIYIAGSSGLYDLVVANSTGCKATSVSPVPVVVNPLPTLSIISVKGNEKFCSGESATLSVPANATYSYNWKRGANLLDITTNSIIASEPGDYTVDISLAGCSVTAEPVKIEVVQKPSKPDIDKGSYTPPEMCLGENPPILSVDNIVAGYTYQWYKNETPLSKSEAIEITEAGNYYLEAVTDICISERDTVIINFSAAPPKPEIIVKGPPVWFLSTTSKATRFKWYFNGSPIADATNSSYVAGHKLGLYRLAVADEGGCYSFSDTIRIPFGITGIEDIDPFEDVKIYPNPTTGMFTIEMNNNVYGELVIDIFSQNGSKVLNIKFQKTTEYFQSQIDLSGQPNGMYLINLAFDKFKTTRKILVE